MLIASAQRHEWEMVRNNMGTVPVRFTKIPGEVCGADAKFVIFFIFFLILFYFILGRGVGGLGSRHD